MPSPRIRCAFVLARLAILCLLLVLNLQAARAFVDVASAKLTRLPQPVQDALSANGLPPGSLGVFVQDVRESKPLLAFDARTPRNPASVMKLVTTLAALETLGPTHRWETQALVTQPIVGGKLVGDLYLRGGGDPYIVTETFWRFLRDLRVKGLAHITGDIVIDNTLFALEPEDPGEFDGKPHRSYNAVPEALLVNFNTTRFTFRPDPVEERIVVTADPPSSRLVIDNRLRYVGRRCGRHLRRLRMDVATDDEHVVVRFSGTYPVSCGSFSLDRSVAETPPYVFGVFASLWSEMGGRIDGGVREGPVPERAEMLHVMPSRTLAELVRAINKYSNNVMTRSVLVGLGVERFGPPGTVAKGRRAVFDWLGEKRIPARDIVLDNGAGLSREARISAATLGELLLVAYASPYMPEFVSSLPLSGADGTMRLRYRRGPLAGRMHMKTGLIDDVTAVAGYLLSESGRRFVVVAMQNHPGIHRGRGRQVQDALLEWVYRQ